MFHVKHKYDTLTQLRHFVAATICYVDRVSSFKLQASSFKVRQFGEFIKKFIRAIIPLCLI
jgi:hypothetical protein